jgi:hypothetical protein
MFGWCYASTGSQGITKVNEDILVITTDICCPQWYLLSVISTVLEGNQLWPMLVIFTNPFLCDTLPQALTSIRSKHIFVLFMTDPSATVSMISYLKHVFMTTDIPPYDSTWIELRNDQLIRFQSTETSDWQHNSNKYWQAWRRGSQTLQNRFNKTKNWGVWQNSETVVDVFRNLWHQHVKYWLPTITFPLLPAVGEQWEELHKDNLKTCTIVFWHGQ